jgi:hypothetical protein
MVANPFFTLANEGNRGVYVPASSMPANEAVLDARAYQHKLGHVF